MRPGHRFAARWSWRSTKLPTEISFAFSSVRRVALKSSRTNSLAFWRTLDPAIDLGARPDCGSAVHLAFAGRHGSSDLAGSLQGLS
jgi:hypothetical protein